MMQSARMAKPKLKDLPDLSHMALAGSSIAVRATPKASRDAISADGGVIRIAVTAAPENGTANAAVRAILAMALGIAPSRLDLVQGQASRDKLFRVAG